MAERTVEDFRNAGVEFCVCGHLNIEHYGAADWQFNPNCAYICGFKGCDCKKFAAEIIAKHAGTPSRVEVIRKEMIERFPDLEMEEIAEFAEWMAASPSHAPTPSPVSDWGFSENMVVLPKGASAQPTCPAEPICPNCHCASALTLGCMNHHPQPSAEGTKQDTP